MRWPWVIARELGLPQGWIDDPARVQAAGVPDQVGFTFTRFSWPYSPDQLPPVNVSPALTCIEADLSARATAA